MANDIPTGRVVVWLSVGVVLICTYLGTCLDAYEGIIPNMPTSIALFVGAHTRYLQVL